MNFKTLTVLLLLSLCCTTISQKVNEDAKNFFTNPSVSLNSLLAADTAENVEQFERKFPTLYEHTYYGGREIMITNSIPNFGLVFSGTNDMSDSIIVPSGWAVVLYHDQNYQGYSSRLESSAPELSSYNMRDAATSARLYHRNSQGTWVEGAPSIATPMLYQNCFYSGPSYKVLQSVPNMINGYGDASNDQVSSLTVPAGWILTVYESINYAGTSTQYIGPDSVSCLSTLDNRISSFRVSHIVNGNTIEGPPPRRQLLKIVISNISYNFNLLQKKSENLIVVAGPFWTENNDQYHASPPVYTGTYSETTSNRWNADEAFRSGVNCEANIGVPIIVESSESSHTFAVSGSSPHTWVSGGTETKTVNRNYVMPCDAPPFTSVACTGTYKLVQVEVPWTGTVTYHYNYNYPESKQEKGLYIGVVASSFAKNETSIPLGV